MNALCWTLIILSLGLLLLTGTLIGICCWRQGQKKKKDKQLTRAKKLLPYPTKPLLFSRIKHPPILTPPQQRPLIREIPAAATAATVVSPPPPSRDHVQEIQYIQAQQAQQEQQRHAASYRLPAEPEEERQVKEIPSRFHDLFHQQVETITINEPSEEIHIQEQKKKTDTSVLQPQPQTRQAAPLPPLPPPPAAPRDPLKQFSVITYNVRVDADKKPHNWDSRKKHVLKNIEQYAPSIICLQESTEKVKRYFHQTLPHFGIVSCRRALNSDEAVPILYNKNHWRKIFAQTYILTNKGPKACKSFSCNGATVFGGKRARHPRILTCVKLQNPVSKFEVVILNTHFPLDYDIQLGCARQIQSLLTKYKNTPVILCGDLNSHYAPTDTASPLQQLLQQRQLQDSHGLIDAPTFGSFSALATESHRLDYILRSPRLTQVDAGISNYTYGPGFRPSDHSLLYAVFNTS